MLNILRQSVIKFLQSKGIKVDTFGTMIAVNRDSMCHSEFANGGIPEETTYPAVLDAVSKQFGTAHHFHWAFKTDDDLFLDAHVSY